MKLLYATLVLIFCIPITSTAQRKRQKDEIKWSVGPIMNYQLSGDNYSDFNRQYYTHIIKRTEFTYLTPTSGTFRVIIEEEFEDSIDYFNDIKFNNLTFGASFRKIKNDKFYTDFAITALQHSITESRASVSEGLSSDKWWWSNSGGITKQFIINTRYEYGIFIRQNFADPVHFKVGIATDQKFLFSRNTPIELNQFPKSDVIFKLGIALPGSVSYQLNDLWHIDLRVAPGFNSFITQYRRQDHPALSRKNQRYLGLGFPFDVYVQAGISLQYKFQTSLKSSRKRN